jgi:long-subunit acyl-CoA synthetase (AMP-forming)
MANEVNIDEVYGNPNNLVDLFEQSVAKYGNNRLFGTKSQASGKYEWTTYRQVADRVNNLRGALKKIGLAKGDSVGVILHNCQEWFICEQAVHGLGGVFVPMYLQEMPKVIEYIVKDAAVKFLFVAHAGSTKKSRISKTVFRDCRTSSSFSERVKIPERALEEKGGKNPAPSLKLTGRICPASFTPPERPAIPRRELTHGNMSMSAKSSIDTFTLDETMHVVAILPWAHIFAERRLHNYIILRRRRAFAESLEKLVQNFQESNPRAFPSFPAS